MTFAVLSPRDFPKKSYFTVIDYAGGFSPLRFIAARQRASLFVPIRGKKQLPAS
jgi:hypothetical protein